MLEKKKKIKIIQKTRDQIIETCRQKRPSRMKKLEILKTFKKLKFFEMDKKFYNLREL